MSIMTDDEFLRLFQRTFGLTADGIAGPATLAKLRELAPTASFPDDWEDITLLADLRRFEGLRLSAYLDTEGVPTIGYGHTGPEVRMGMPPWTVAQAEEALRRDVAEHDALLFSALPWARRLDPARRRVMRNLAFNMGVGWPPEPPGKKGRGLRSFVNTLAAIQAGQWDKAADGLLASKWARQVGPTRSGYLAGIMRTGRVG